METVQDEINVKATTSPAVELIRRFEPKQLLNQGSPSSLRNLKTRD